MRILIVLSSALFMVSSLHGYEFDYFPAGQTGGQPFEYLSDYTNNAQASALGNAFTAKNSRAVCSYWNPAGISEVNYTEFTVSNAVLFSQTQQNCISFAHPLNDDYVFGFSSLQLISGNALKTDSVGDSRGYTFNETQTASFITFSRKLNSKTYIGINFKVVSQAIDTVFGQGQSVDFGVIRNNTEETSYGLTVQNMVPITIGPDTAGINLKTGIENKFIKDRLNAFLDVSILNINKGTQSNLIRWGLGVEYKIIKQLWIRAGINSREVSAGLGINADKMDFDYSASFHPIDMVHRFSVSYRFGYTPTGQELLLKKKTEELYKRQASFLDERNQREESLKAEREKLKFEEWINIKLMLARENYEDGNYSAANQLLQELLQKDPDNVSAKELENEIEKKGQINYAAQKYLEAMDLYKQNRFDEAQDAVKKIIIVDKNHKGANILAYLIKAQLLLKEQKYLEAKNVLMELLGIDSSNSEALTLLKRIQAVIDIMGPAQQ